MNVLLSSVSRKVSLARSFHEACRKSGGHLYVADMNQNCAGMYEGDDAFQLPALDSEAFKPVLLGRCKQFDIKLVIPTRDEEVAAFADWKDEFAKEGILLLAPSKDTVQLCQDKILFADWCTLSGFRVPYVYGSHDLAFPAFMRSRRGKGSSAAVRVKNFEEFKRILELFGPKDTITQEYVRAPEYSVDVFATQDGTVISAVPRQRVSIVAGESWVTVTVKGDLIQAEAVKLAKALQLTGHAVMQCFVKDGKVLWIEVNPRFGGASACAFEAGCKSPEWLLNGVTVTTTPVPYEVGVMMLRYTQDRFVRTA